VGFCPTSVGGILAWMRTLLIIAALSACRDVYVPDLVVHDGQPSDDGNGIGDAGGDPNTGDAGGDPNTGDPGDPNTGDPAGDPAPMGDTAGGDTGAGDTSGGDAWTPPASGVYNGSAAIAGSANSGTVDIGSVVEIDKTIVFHQATRNADGNPGNDAVTAELIDSGNGTATQLRFRREGAGGTGCTIQWSVVSFASGVTVQHGEYTLASSPDNVTVSAVTVASTFVISSWRMSGAAYGLNDWGVVELTSATNLRVRNATNGVTVRYQVVDMAGASVQQRGLSLTGAGATNNDNASISAVDRTRTFLVASQEGVDAGNTRACGARVHLTSDTNLRCSHSSWTEPRDVWVYVVQLPVGRGTVEQKTPTMDNTTAQRDITIATVDTTTTSAFSPFQGLVPAQNPQWDGNNAGQAMSHRLALTSPTTVRVDREAFPMDIDFSFFVVEWVTD